MGLDAHSDTTQLTMQALSRRIGHEGFMKVAAFVQESDKPVEARFYADMEHKDYACHTKEATLVNYAYFVDNRDNYNRTDRERIQNRFNEKLAFWDLEDSVKDIEEAVTKTAAVKYAMEISGDALFGYNDKDSLVKAASDFYENRHRFPYENRKAASQKLLKEAEKSGVTYSNDVVRFLKKSAGWAIPSADGIVSLVHRRVYDRDFKNTEHLSKIAEAGAALAKDVKGDKLYDTEKVAAFLLAVDAYDRITKVASRYSNFGVPEEFVFGDTEVEKVASEFKAVVKLTNGREVTLSDGFFQKLSSADPDLAKSIMGNADKAREILPTLPRPDADYIVETCGE